MNVDEAHALQPGEFGDAARNNIVFVDTVKGMPVNLSFPKRIGADQKTNALSTQGIDTGSQFLIGLGHLEKFDTATVIDDADLDMILAHRLNMILHAIQHSPEVTSVVRAAPVVVIDDLLVLEVSGRCGVSIPEAPPGDYYGEGEQGD